MVSIGKPAPDLAQQVELWWARRSEGETDRQFFEIHPEGNMSLIFRFSSSNWRLSLIGPRSEKTTVEIDKASDYFCISFRPGQAPRLADVQPSELIDTYVDIPRLGGMSAGSLADLLCSLDDPESRKRAVEQLVRGVQPLVRDGRCRRAAGILHAHGGRLQVNQLADGLGMHVRSLERLFQDQLGMSPKQLARLVRFRALVLALLEGRYGTLADLACACGYADQSHMIREFKEFTGRLPGEPGACEMQPVEGEPRTRIVHRYRP